MIGQEILGYRVDEKIGSGGFGTVYKVSKTNAAGTYVRALKHITLPTKKQYAGVLNSMGGDYAKADDYFAAVLNDIVSEIRILSTLSESGIQNIVRYYENDIIETASPKSYDIYILMEYLTPFSDYLENKELSVRDVIKLGTDMLMALIPCHEKKIIHRDIKDDNIFVSADGIYKLGDFGVSKALKDKSRAESVKGTPNFIAPEVYLGKEKYDHTVDLYSLGIVLYKLLNKSRNPFLPTFPAPYNTDDEDVAFEERMTSKVPALPLLANNALGEAVVKAIRPRADRYNTAGEFLEALKWAASTLSDEELGVVVNVVAPSGTNRTATATLATDDKRRFTDETVGGEVLLSKNRTVMPEEDRHLFDTIATSVPREMPDVRPKDAPVPPYTPPRQAYEEAPSYRAPMEIGEPPKVPVVTKKDLSWLIYLSPLVIAILYIGVYLIALPRAYGKVVSAVEWLFENPRNILTALEALKEPGTVLIPSYSIVGFKILNWVLSAAFIASLFRVGHTIQNKKPKTSMDAKLVGKEPYTIALDLLEQIKLITEQDVGAAKKAVQSVSERLRNESAFGSGNASVIRCENEIASYLKAIESYIPGLYQESSVEEATREIVALSQKILGKLKIRMELKKK